MIMKAVQLLIILLLMVTSSCKDLPSPNDSLNVNFDQMKPGKLTDRQTKELWPGAQLVCGKKDFLFYKTGITPHPHFIDEENGNHFLKVLIPKKHYGPIVGAQWKIPLAPKDEYLFSYKVKFEHGFDFVKGGKLPGMAGGVANSSDHVADGYNGWSARMMFWEEGKLSFLLYYPNQTSKWGQRLYLRKSPQDTLRLIPGQWHQITQHIRMNDLGKRNGIIEALVDGKQAFFADTILFRKDDKLAIDQVFYSVFLGGDNLSWTSSKDEYIYFDDFYVSTQQTKQ